MTSSTRCLALAAIVLTAAAAPPAPARAQSANDCGGVPCFQIGTYNIEWLGTETHHPPRSQATVRRIAQLLAEHLDVEVLVFEEINAASQEYAWLSEALGGYGYVLLPGSSGGQQNVVIAYDKDEVSQLSPAAELDVPTALALSGNCGDPDRRKPLAVRLKAGAFDFVLVGVHLKSKRKVDEAANPTECQERLRTEQVREIVARLAALEAAHGDKDVIVAGDFNMQAGEAAFGPLTDAKFVSLVTDGRRSGDSGAVSYDKGQYRELIDHVMVREPDAAGSRWIKGSTFVKKLPQAAPERDEYQKQFSDHLPVWTSFRTN